MPLYDEDEVKKHTVTFKDDVTLDLTLREDFGSSVSARKAMKNYNRAQAASNRIALLKKQQQRVLERAESLEEFDKLEKQIEDIEPEADYTRMLAEFIFACASGWSYYATREDEKAGKPKEFTVENIAKINMNRLKAISDSLAAEMGLSGEEDPKASPAKSPAASTSADTAAQSHRSGTQT